MPVALQFELIRSIVAAGVRCKAGDIVDPSTDSSLRKAGVALITTYVEQLSATR